MNCDISSRLLIIRKLRGNSSVCLQDTVYTRDPLDRVNPVIENAQQASYLNNTIIWPSFHYTYDAIGHLTAVEERQQIDYRNRGGQRFQSREHVRLYAGQHSGHGNSGLKMSRDLPIQYRSCSYDESSAMGLNATSNRLFQTETKHNLDVYHYDEKSTGSGCIASVSGFRCFTRDYVDRIRSSSARIMKCSGARSRKTKEHASTGKPTRLTNKASTHEIPPADSTYGKTTTGNWLSQTW
ncbi:uncharacterized protein RAG0_15546 [Rhynchosporium agropyri]|uniref:Uncharacterized protein n=1 Tax=Rhynchosporium agropyri TaxID=914238 RepID=A0A1E1LLI4_9HELO|nr:uncharacterized protein RAG0_15546 [Rhynchosporium agropyri]